MKERALLVPMNRGVRGVEIKDNLRRRHVAALQEQIHEKTVEKPVVGHDLLVAMRQGLVRQAKLRAV